MHNRELSVHSLQTYSLKLLVVFELNLVHNSTINIVEVDHLLLVPYRFNVLKVYTNLRSNFHIVTRKSLSGNLTQMYFKLFIPYIFFYSIFLKT